MPSLQVEIWQGFIFVNFDPAAKPLAPQLDRVSKLLDRRRLSEYRFAGSADYDAPWNWKFSIENGGEAYHHLGIHYDRINHIVPGDTTHVGDTSGPYFTYYAPGAPGSEHEHLVLGRPPHMNDDDYDNILETARHLCISVSKSDLLLPLGAFGLHIVPARFGRAE